MAQPDIEKMMYELPEKCAILVNLAANSGRAAQKWKTISQILTKQLPEGSRVHYFHPSEGTVPIVHELLGQGFRTFISAGGDGSVNYLLNQLMNDCGEHAQHLRIGGIGLGSSNDFIKPRQHFLRGIPIRLNALNANLADVGKMEWETKSGEIRTSYFIVNASMGVTAAANWYFNHGGRFLRLLKKRWPDGAILYAALGTIFHYQNLPVLMEAEDGTKHDILLSNLAVLKSPYVSGSFYYDDPVTRNDGQLGVNLCLNMSRVALVRVLYGLSKGYFRGRPQTLSFATKVLRIHPKHLTNLEFDGEVELCRSVQFSVCHQAIQLMAL